MICAFAGDMAAEAAVSPGLTVVSGNGQVVWEYFRTTVPMVVQAIDANGKPVPNLPVSWSITQGQGTLAGPPDTKTDSNGLATSYFVATAVTAGYSFQGQTVTVSSALGSASFYVTTVLGRLPNGGAGPMPLVQVLSPPYENRNFTGKAGATIAGAIQIIVAAQAGPQQGAPIPNVAMKIVDATNPTGPSPAACNGTPLTDASGKATCDLVLTGTPGTYLIAASVGDFNITYSSYLTITPGDNCSFTLSPATANFTAPGGNGTVTVTSGAACGWTANSNVNWISIVSGAAGTGTGPVSYSVSPNAGITRTGTLTIGGQTFTITQTAPGSGGGLTITSGTALPAAIANTAYSFTIGVSGGTAPYSFTALSGLPGGLSLNPSTGAITGIAAATGTYTLTIRVSDANGQSQTQNFTLNVVTATGGANPSILNSSFPNGAIGAAYSQTLNATGGCLSPFSAPAVYSISAGSLPPGLNLVASANGTTAITGTPTTNGSYSFTLKVTDSCGRSGTSNFVLTIGTGGGGGGGNGNVVLQPSPSSVQIAIPVGFTSVAGQTITLTSNIPALYTAQAQMITAASAGWLGVAPTSGATPATLTVTVGAGNLPPGTYLGNIILLPAGGATGTPVTIPVSMRVDPPPTLAVLPGSLFYLYSPGTAFAGSQTLNISSTGSQFGFNVTASTQSGGSWLIATPSSSATPGNITISANPIGLGPGTYQGTVVITPVQASVAPLTIPVTLSIPQGAPAVTAIVNAASFLPGPISPGEMVTIYGTGMGPANLTPGRKTAAGLLDTTAGETRVLFDGAPGPVVYTSATQVAAIVPYSVSGRASTRLTVEYKGLPSPGIDQRVVDSAPGIFTSSSAGQAAAVNQDGSVNSSQTGADPGSVIAVYMTGEGQTDPQGVDGRFMGDLLAKPLLGVTAQVGGKDAAVLYAGSAPGLPAGIMQVNVRLPDDLPHGTAVPVVITVGRAASQPGVTAFVR